MGNGPVLVNVALRSSDVPNGNAVVGRVVIVSLRNDAGLVAISSIAQGNALTKAATAACCLGTGIVTPCWVAKSRSLRYATFCLPALSPIKTAAWPASFLPAW